MDDSGACGKEQPLTRWRRLPRTAQRHSRSGPQVETLPRRMSSGPAMATQRDSCTCSIRSS